MNETVRGMVEKLFENTVMNEETQALMDEVMNNCQERWADLTEKGLPEEEVLAAVSESLKGMEEIVSAYPKKEEHTSVSVPDNDLPEGTLSFEPAAVGRLVARLTDATVEVFQGEGPCITVELTHGPDTSLRAEMDGDVLRITQRRILGGGQTEQAAKPRAPWDIAGSINDAIRQLTQAVQRFGVNVSGETNHVRICVPGNCRIVADIQSLSGDIRWDGAAAAHLLLDTTSGDLDAFAQMDPPASVAQFKSASGDIRADLDAEDLTMQSMSGDIHWAGKAERLTVTSISGDLNMKGSFRECRLKSVSGDVEVSADALTSEIRAISTSGDVVVSLPPAVTAAKAALRTVSGDTHVNNLLLTDNAQLFIQADSVSGDITVTRHKM